MQTKEESTTKISETGRKIRENHPKSSQFVDEMNSAIPNEKIRKNDLYNYKRTKRFNAK